MPAYTCCISINCNRLAFLAWEFEFFTVFLHFSFENKCQVITSIYQWRNAHIISHKTLLKHFKTLRHVSELCSLLKLCYNIHNSIRICKRGVLAAYHAPQHIPTQHDVLPEHLVCKYELNCEYCNITLERNKAPWWWSDKIETCQSVLKCFKSVLCEIICAFVGW